MPVARYLQNTTSSLIVLKARARRTTRRRRTRRRCFESADNLRRLSFECRLTHRDRTSSLAAVIRGKARSHTRSGLQWASALSPGFFAATVNPPFLNACQHAKIFDPSFVVDATAEKGSKSRKSAGLDLTKDT